MRSSYFYVLFLAPSIVLTPALAQPGKIVAANDEWTLSNSGFTNGPDAAIYARNVASFFAPSGQGNFLARSGNFGLRESSLSATMIAAGHTWTVSNQIAVTLANLSQYDAVFIQASEITPGYVPIFTEYVQSGGSVYVCAGSGSVAAANSFLQPFGLAFNVSYDTPSNQLLPIVSSHPIMSGVRSLFNYTGNSVYDLSSDDSSQVIAMWTTKGIYGVYEVASTPCPADFNQDGGVDGADVDAFFAAWESGDSAADVNQDGGVDGADVGVFFEAWEAGGC